MSKQVLVVHPRDGTTTFLQRIYRDLDATVITHDVSQDEIRAQMEKHDQIIMLGHGTPHGLLSIGQFGKVWPEIIDDSFTAQLRERDNSIFIWCHADQFVRYNRLKGFTTGMFVSEMSEARAAYSIPKDVTEAEIEESNDTFADVVGRFATQEPRLLHAAVKHEYGTLAETNPVAHYNNTRVYWINELPPLRKPWSPSNGYYNLPSKQAHHSYGLWPEDDGYLDLENQPGLVPITR